MKSRFLISFCFLILSLTVFGRKIPGYYITPKNDTVRVMLKVPLTLTGPDLISLQYKVKCYGKDGKKIKLYPKMAKEVGFEHKKQTYRMIKVKNDIDLVANIFADNSLLFLHLIKDGSLRVFNFYYKQSSPMVMGAGGAMYAGAMTFSADRAVLQRDGKLFRPSWISFKKDMAEYLSDCPSVSKRIKAKEFKNSELLEIVDEYNSACGKKVD